LIGEHVDYNGGPVLPLAIERQVMIAGAPNDGSLGRIWSESFGEWSEIPLGSKIQTGPPRWSGYIRGVLDGFARKGVVIPGFDAAVVSDVPHGCGLSSSAALEVAAATLIESVAGVTLEPAEKALLCQTAEQEYAGVPCGIMDQFASVFGRKNHVILIDCRTRQVTPIPLPSNGVAFLVIDTGVKHSLADGAYAERRRSCDAAARKLGVDSLRDWPADRLTEARGKLDPVLFKRTRHVVTEIDRTYASVGIIRDGDWARFGQLMYASHGSLRDDYEVSCPELDEIVRLAEEIGVIGGVLGCRMTGGGFGGSAIALVKADALRSAQDRLLDGYRRRFPDGVTFLVTGAADGASIETII
jgi:galactokinase